MMFCELRKWLNFKECLCSIFCVLVFFPFTVGQAQTLGTPVNLSDSYDAANQVGFCVDSGGSGSCTANDFLITNIDILNVDDGCSGPDDYMQIDADVFFNKATPSRFDITVWFYRGDDQAVLPNPDFISQDARNGDFCSRISLESGLDINREVAPFDVVGTTGLIDPDSCADVPNTPNGDIRQTVLDLVLPCRDIGVPDPNDPQGAPLSTIPDGTVDISGCTSWDNNAADICDGPEYDGVNEPAAGTGAKCNCGEFSGITTQAGLPDISVDKSCTPVVLEPGEATMCTITITNSGTGAQLGATAAGVEGFFYEDDYPEQYGSVSNIVISQGSAVDGFTLDSFGLPTTNQSLNIYPGDIAGGTSLTVTYDFVTDASALPSTETSISNTVCASYFDFGEDGSAEVFSYAFDPDLCDTQIVTTPITLAGFSAVRDSGGIQFNWVTATEANNLGFNLYSRRGHTLFKLSPQLIPSKVISSLDATEYSSWLAVGAGSADRNFYLEDIDIEGNSTWHGPFELSAAQAPTGQFAVRVTDWRSIHQQNAAFRNGNNGNSQNVGTDSSVRVLNLHVAESGLQRVAMTAIAAQGIDARHIKSGKYQLRDASGLSVPTRYVKSAGGEGYLEFIAETTRSFYADYGGYQLHLLDKPGSGNSMQTRHGSNQVNNVSPSDHYLHSVEVADNNIYTNTSRIEADPWMMNTLFAINNPVSRTVQVPVPDVYSAAGGTAVVSAQVSGGIDFPDEFDHHVQMSVASETLDTIAFGGPDWAALEGQLAVDQLGSAVDVTLTLNPLNSRNIGLAYTNKVSVTYPRRYVAIDDSLRFQSTDDFFRISGFTDTSVNVYARTGDATIFLGSLPVESGVIEFSGVAGALEYMVFGNSTARQPVARAVEIRDITSLGANHLVISHADFAGQELTDYVNARAGQGESAIVTTAEIYSQFSGGVLDAEAIHEYLIAYAANQQLDSVMLVGGDVYDYHDNLGIGAVSFVPTLYRATDWLIQYSPTDSLFGDIDRDDVPDVPVGRLPVRTHAELTTLLTKMTRYAQNGNNKQAVLVADGLRNSNAYNFTAASEKVAHSLQQDDWQITRAYVDTLGADGARQAMIDGFNSGPRLALYTGHSAPSAWGVNWLFSYADTLNLSNQEPGAYLQWGCYNTFFSSPTSDSMSHGLMLAGSQGAAAVIGSSTLSNAFAEEEYARLIQDELLLPDTSLGAAVIAAKQQFHKKTGLQHKDIMWGVTLLGDPLLEL